MTRASVAAVALLCAGPAGAQDGLGGQLPDAPPPAADVADPVAAAIIGLNAQVEGDLNSRQLKLDGAVTSDCVTRLVSGQVVWPIDWRKIDAVEPGDTFVFVAGPGVKLAIVGDASDPVQAGKLAALLAAMRAMRTRCPG